MEFLSKAEHALEYRGVEVEPLPDLTAADAARVTGYPVSDHRPADGAEGGFGSGLLARLDLVKAQAAKIAHTRRVVSRA